jgi:hypothetical protein
MVETPEEGMRLLQECSAIDILAIADGPLLVRRSES